MVVGWVYLRMNSTEVCLSGLPDPTQKLYTMTVGRIYLLGITEVADGKFFMCGSYPPYVDKIPRNMIKFVHRIFTY